MTAQALVFRYTVFAVLATLANLATQRSVLWFGDTSMLFILGLLAGTAMGLVLKYALDKRWIFGDISVGVKAHSKRFPRYMTTGIITTLLFWGVETMFWLVWKTNTMREFGAVFGLSIGYIVKYHLDRRFVFTDLELTQV